MTWLKLAEDDEDLFLPLEPGEEISVEEDDLPYDIYKIREESTYELSDENNTYTIKLTYDYSQGIEDESTIVEDADGEPVNEELKHKLLEALGV
jgi:hypothetical protein